MTRDELVSELSGEFCEEFDEPGDTELARIAADAIDMLSARYGPTLSRIIEFYSHNCTQMWDAVSLAEFHEVRTLFVRPQPKGVHRG